MRVFENLFVGFSLSLSLSALVPFLKIYLYLYHVVKNIPRRKKS